MPRPPTSFPRALVTFDGQPVRPEHLISLQWEPTVTYQADSLSVVLDNSEGLSDFIRKEQLVDLYLGWVADSRSWSQAELTHVFHGQADGVLPDFSMQQVVTVRCRDLSRLLIDSEVTATTYANMTYSDLVIEMAKAVGLTTDVTATPLTIGAQEWQSFNKQSRWDVVQQCAAWLGWIAYVNVDGVLVFGPRHEADVSVGTWTYFDAPQDLLGVTFDDSALVPNTITVVRWLGADNGLIKATARDVARIVGAGGRIIERRLVSSTAKTIEDCQAEADALLKESTRPTVMATATLEGDVALRGDTHLMLAGTKLGRFVGDYYVESATHSHGMAGYTVQASLTNIRPETSEQYRKGLYDDTLLDPILACAEQQNRLSQAALAMVGAQYCLGGGHAGSTCPAGTYDCSGFVAKAFADIGIRSLAGLTAEAMAATLPAVSATQARVGDLAFLPVNPATGYAHVGIILAVNAYNGVSKPSQIIDAGDHGVQTSTLDSLGTTWLGQTIWTTATYGRVAELCAGADALSEGPSTVAVPASGVEPGIIERAPEDLAHWIKYYFPQAEWDNAATISYFESTWNRTANRNTVTASTPCGTPLGNGIVAEDSRGYFQINTCTYGTSKDWYDTRTNVGYAYQLWSASGRWGVHWVYSAKKAGLS